MARKLLFKSQSLLRGKIKMKKITQGIVLLLFFISIPVWGLDTPTITAKAKGPNQINLVWSTVSNPGWGYKVEIKSDEDPRYTSWTDLTASLINGRTCLPYWVTESHYKDPIDNPATACQFPVFSLRYGTDYNFRVRAYGKTDSGAEVYSPYSETVKATTTTPARIKHVSTNGNDGNTGDSEGAAWRHISYAASHVTAGTLIIIHRGNYASDSLHTSASGTSHSNMIWFVVDPGETATITTGSGGQIISVSHNYICVDGLRVTATTSDETVLVTGSRDIFANCEWQGNSQDPRWGGATYNFIHGLYSHDYGDINNAESGSTLALLNGSNYNIIQYSHFARGGHDTGLNKNGSNYNQWMNNLHDGGWGLGWEAVSSGGQASCQYVLFEGNIVKDVQQLTKYSYTKPGIELSGSYCTVRRNLIYDGRKSPSGDISFGIEISNLSYVGNDSNLIYNNVIYHNGSFGIRHYIYGSNTKVYNNIFYYNAGLETSPANATICVDSQWNSGTMYKNNLILFRNWNTHADVPDMATVALNYTGTAYSVSDANTHWSTYFQGNITSNPGFIDETNREFHLKSTSPAKDAGVPLTDSVWGTIDYNGVAPDIGAFEYSEVGEEVKSPPAPPTGLRILP
jgi:hypothetical protein